MFYIEVIGLILLIFLFRGMENWDMRVVGGLKVVCYYC